MPRRALSLFAILLLTVATWVLWGDSNHDPASDDRSEATAAELNRAHQTTDGASEIAEIERQTAAAETEVGSEPEPEYATPSTADDALTIEVFDLSSGEVAAGAEVYYADRGLWSDDYRLEAYREEKSTTGRAMRYGVRYLADEDGRVKVPARTGHATIAAHRGKLYGSKSTTMLPAGGAETLRIDLEPRLDLTAKVLQADNSPAADCSVTFAYLVGRGQFYTSRAGKTNSDGVFKFEHLQERGPMGGSGRPHLIITEPLAEEVRVEMERTDWPDEPVTLQLPATGALDVQIVAGGEPHPLEGGWVTAVQLPRDGSEFDEMGWRLYRPGIGGVRKTDANGIAHFPYVSPGAGLQLQLNQTEENEARTAPADVRVVADTSNKAEIALGEPLAFVVARVVDASGQPRPHLSVIAGLAGLDEQYSYGGRPVVTDAEGYIRTPVTDREAPGGKRRGLRVNERQDADGSIYRAHVVPVPQVLDSGDNHVGDIVLGGRVAVSGRVVSTDGAAIEGAFINLNAGTREDTERLAYASSNPRGEFLFDFEVPSDSLFLSVSPPSPYKLVEVDFVAGQTDLVVTVQEANSLSGNLLLPEGVPYSILRIVAQEVDGDWVGRSFHPDQDHRFRFDDLPAGSEFELTVSSWDDDEPYFTSRYRLAASEHAAPDELNPLDLRDRVQYHQLEILHEDGSKPKSISVETYLPSGERRTSSTHDSNLYRTLSSAKSLEVLAKAPGCVPKWVTVEGDAEVRLSRGSEVTVEVDVPALPEGQVLVLTFQGYMDLGREHNAILRDELVVSETGTHHFMIPAKVSYSVSAEREPSHRMGEHYPVALPTSARTFDASRDSVYELTLPADAFASEED